MAHLEAHKRYTQQMVTTASPAKLLYMAYEHIISALHNAIQAIEEGDIEKRWKSNNKACEIIGHLWGSLDMENGKEIADNLGQLYAFMLTKLPEVDFKNNPQPARDAIKLLIPLRDAWKELSENMSPSELEQAALDAKNGVTSAPAPAAAEPAKPAPASAPNYAASAPAPKSSPAQSGVSVSV